MMYGAGDHHEAWEQYVADRDEDQMRREDLQIKGLLAKYGTGKNGHAHFAPSASAGWLNCAGFLLANAKAPDDAGIDAAYGTVAHHVAERWQKHGKKPVKLIGRVEEAEAGGKVYDITIDEAMMEFVEEYIKWCDEVPGEHFYEQKVQFGDLMPIPDQSGTADHFAIHQADDGSWHLTITDLKMGTGVRVFAKDNTQAQLYALGVFREWDWMYGFESVTIRICQPRLNVFETWERTRAEILAFEQFVHERSRLAWVENAPRTPSPKACQWCKVATTCAARLQQADDLIDAVFEADDEEPFSVEQRDSNIAHSGDKTYTAKEVTSVLPLKGFMAVSENPQAFKALSDTGISYVLTFRKTIEKMFSAMAEEALRRAENGRTLPFQILVKGRTQRKWSDQSAARAYLIKELGLPDDKVRPRSFISVAEAEKLIRTELKHAPADIKLMLENNPGVNKMAGKRTLADITDDRPDVNDLLDDTFEADAEEDDDEL